MEGARARVSRLFSRWLGGIGRHETRTFLHEVGHLRRQPAGRAVRMQLGAHPIEEEALQTVEGRPCRVRVVQERRDVRVALRDHKLRATFSGSQCPSVPANGHQFQPVAISG